MNNLPIGVVILIIAVVLWYTAKYLFSKFEPPARKVARLFYSQFENADNWWSEPVPNTDTRCFGFTFYANSVGVANQLVNVAKGRLRRTYSIKTRSIRDLAFTGWIGIYRIKHPKYPATSIEMRVKASGRSGSFVANGQYMEGFKVTFTVITSNTTEG